MIEIALYGRKTPDTSWPLVLVKVKASLPVIKSHWLVNDRVTWLFGLGQWPSNADMIWARSPTSVFSTVQVFPHHTQGSCPFLRWSHPSPLDMWLNLCCFFYLFYFICDCHYISHYHPFFIFKAKKRSLLVLPQKYGSWKGHGQWIRMKGVGDWRKCAAMMSYSPCDYTTMWEVLWRKTLYRVKTLVLLHTYNIQLRMVLLLFPFSPPSI